MSVIIPIDNGTGALQPQVDASINLVGIARHLQVIGLTAAGGTVTIEESADGINFTVASFDGETDWVISADGNWHFLGNKNFIRAVYSGNTIPQGLKVLVV